ncbi:MAG: S41 family peptidase [Bernardetiaceae bacterium]|nr:S41 family peptidase [Bernardetiaceae bacterium]
MNKIINTIALFLIVLVASSCEQALFEENQKSSEPLVNFNYLWDEVDRKYSYFDLKQIDWDEVRVRYEAQISEDMSEEELFNVLANMLNELRDDHTNLVSPFNISVYNVALRGDENFRRRTIEEFYLPNFRITGAFVHDFLFEEQEIAYIRYGSFMSPVSSDVMDHLLTRYADTKGIILDLRSNGGGTVTNIPAILERFVSERTLVGSFITRNGRGRQDFGEPQDFHIGSHDGIRYEKPVMVLIDRGSYSATTMFAVATKAFPHIKLIGDTTGGGGGLPNGGQLPNGWLYRFSISQLLDLNGDSSAEDGVAPDIRASFDWSDLTKDEILERAVEEIRNM